MTVRAPSFHSLFVRADGLTTPTPPQSDVYVADKSVIPIPKHNRPHQGSGRIRRSWSYSEKECRSNIYPCRSSMTTNPLRESVPDLAVRE